MYLGQGGGRWVLTNELLPREEETEAPKEAPVAKTQRRDTSLDHVVFKGGFNLIMTPGLHSIQEECGLQVWVTGLFINTTSNQSLT